MTARLALRVAFVAIFAASALSTASCGRRASAQARSDAGAALPVVRAESDGLLLTWIDDKGDFHVEARVADVPLMGRDIVRVENASGESNAAPDQVVIVDLRDAGPSGAFPVRTMSRVDFEAIAVARREKAGPTLANKPPPPPPPAAAPGAAPSSTEEPAPSRAVVIIYGAEWCSACHEAARYLRHKGIAYVEKDIEKDETAAREMQEKLTRSGLRGGSIPVIDVRGKIMVGFDPGQIDAALGRAM